jgi:hypothetical protein
MSAPVAVASGTGNNGATGSATGGKGQTFEAWAGVDAANAGWSVYGGVTAAPFSDVRSDGFRVRSSAGHSRYSYGRAYFDPFRRQLVWAKFDGRATSTDVLLGYQQSFGPVIVKLFAGLASEQHTILPGKNTTLAFDADNTVQGDKIGAKLVLETWTRLGDWGFVQADMNWSQPFDTYGGRLRLGYRLDPNWSAGLEAAAHARPLDQGRPLNLGARTGAFLRFEWTNGEVSLSSGVDGNRDEVDGIYGSLNATFRF